MPNPIEQKLVKVQHPPKAKPRLVEFNIKAKGKEPQHKILNTVEEIQAAVAAGFVIEECPIYMDHLNEHDWYATSTDMNHFQWGIEEHEYHFRQRTDLKYVWWRWAHYQIGGQPGIVYFGCIRRNTLAELNEFEKGSPFTSFVKWQGAIEFHTIPKDTKVQ